MRKYTNDQYTAIFPKLPKEIQDIVASPIATTDIIVKIGNKHNLQLDQIDTLINITLDVLMGMTASKKIVEEITENCALPRTDASIIVREIDEEIFKPVKELMMKIYADGAPYKPDTLRTASEKDNDHSHIDKNEILREIEDPVAVPSLKLKVERERPKTETTFYTPATTKEIEEYHTEISLGKKIEEKNPKPTVGQENDLGVLSQKKPDYRSISPTGISNIEESKKRLLESIASQKLSGVFTMPNTSNETFSIPPKSQPTKETVGAPIAPPTKKVEEVVKSGDPYREALK